MLQLFSALQSWPITVLRIVLRSFPVFEIRFFPERHAAVPHACSKWSIWPPVWEEISSVIDKRDIWEEHRVVQSLDIVYHNTGIYQCVKG